MNRSQRRAANAGQPAGAWLALANTEFRRGRLGEAHAVCTRILTREPGHPQALHLAAMIAQRQGRLPDAWALLNRALASAPEEAAIHDALAQTCRLLERPVDAERHYRRVAELRPGPVTHLNLGNALFELGRPADAEAAYRSGLRLDGRLPELHHALGRALVAQGQPATDAFSRAIELRPHFAAAHEDLVDARFPEEPPGVALCAVCEALLHADTPRLRVQFIDALRASPPLPDLPALRQILQRALAERWTRPQDLVRPACEFAALGDVIDPLGPTLGLVLELAPICHPAIERALTMQRRSLLARAVAGESLPADALASACKLARQCFINEYAWRCTQAEHAEVATLRELIEDALARGRLPPDTQLVAIAQYLALGSLCGAGRLLSGPRPATVASLLAQQITEPAEEARLGATIRIATPIDDAISQAVRDQYEASPYPRWVATSNATHRIHLGHWLAARFPNAPLTPVPVRLDVLIAGCGTGQQALDTVRDIAGSSGAGSSVLAIDLSLASLAYAARMTASLGVETIAYAQADLLRVAELERSFDLICVGGVLHHLADPWTGWRALLGVLRPGGVMNVLLYTVRGRGDVTLARDWIASRGWQAEPDAIRDCRQELLALPDEWAIRLRQSPDFFSLSGCRDLLFHVQERPVSLPEIARFLDTAGLTLLGVEVPQATEQTFLATYPGSLRDLACWDLFEAGNPGCFAGMVNLWVQKQGSQGSALHPLKA